MDILASKHTRPSVQDFTKLTPERLQDQFIELIKISQCADVALLSHLNLDAKFNNPIIGNHLKRIKDSAEAIKSELRTNKKYGFKSKDNDFTEDVSAEISALMSILPNFGREGVQAVTQNLSEQLENLKKQQP